MGVVSIFYVIHKENITNGKEYLHALACES